MSGELAPEVEVLKEILKWVRFTGMKEVKVALETALDNDQKKIAYHVSDGTRSTRDVATLASYGSKSTIEVLWKKWRRLGLGESFQVMGGGERFKRSFDLEDFDIEIPRTRGSQPPGESGSEKGDPNA